YLMCKSAQDLTLSFSLTALVGRLDNAVPRDLQRARGRIANCEAQHGNHGPGVQPSSKLRPMDARLVLRRLPHIESTVSLRNVSIVFATIRSHRRHFSTLGRLLRGSHDRQLQRHFKIDLPCASIRGAAGRGWHRSRSLCESLLFSKENVGTSAVMRGRVYR